LVFDSRTLEGRTAAAGGGARPLQKLVTIGVAGRSWELSFGSPGAEYGVERTLPPVVLLGGILTSLLLFWLIATLSLSRARALQLADQATTVRTAESLREQLNFIQQLIETV